MIPRPATGGLGMRAGEASGREVFASTQHFLLVRFGTAPHFTCSLCGRGVRQMAVSLWLTPNGGVTTLDETRGTAMPAVLPTPQDDSAAPPPGRVTEEEARAMLRAILTLFDRWQLTARECRVLLGDPSERTYQRWRRGDVGGLRS